jgi:adenosylmethionine-8-amino-7-oxononanoate aminotransferase
MSRVFYSDDGSTAVEVALKMSFQYWTQQTMEKPRRRYLALQGSYHGDTLGAVSLGHVDLFDRKFKPLLVKSDAAPLCAKAIERALHTRKYAAIVVEPLVQGVAGMLVHPRGFLRKIAAAAKQSGTLLILDEVMTGFGRTGTMFACEQERVSPDFLCVAKGLTGGTMPLAATLTTEKVFRAFLGKFEELKTFFHGHSYTGNPLGCASALANLEIFEREGTLARIRALGKALAEHLEPFRRLPRVRDIRQAGLIAGIELGPYPWQQRMGAKVCERAKQNGVLTRPIGNVVVIMPPYCVTPADIKQICQVIHEAIEETCE